MADSSREIIGDPRLIVSPDGERWSVYELSGAPYDQRQSLVFESAAGVRRVFDFPSDWRALPDTELYRWSWRA